MISRPMTRPSFAGGTGNDRLEAAGVASDVVDAAMNEMTTDIRRLLNQLMGLQEDWRTLSCQIREKDKHSPVANELENCADDLLGHIGPYFTEPGETEQ